MKAVFLFFASLMALIILPSKNAYACSPAFSPEIRSQFLGDSIDCFDCLFPRNFALLFASSIYEEYGSSIIDLSNNTAVEWGPSFDSDHPNKTIIYYPIEPLDPNTTYQYNGEDLAIENILDLEAPPTPTIIEAAIYRASPRNDPNPAGCGGFGRHDFSVHMEPLEDNHTEKRQLTFAFFVGTTPEESSNTPYPSHYATAWDLQDELRSWIDANDHYAFSEETGQRSIDSPLFTEGNFVSISAIDLAGNMSPRTEPILIETINLDESPSPESPNQETERNNRRTIQSCSTYSGTSPLWTGAWLILFALITKRSTQIQ